MNNNTILHSISINENPTNIIARYKNIVKNTKKFNKGILKSKSVNGAINKATIFTDKTGNTVRVIYLVTSNDKVLLKVIDDKR
jgi:hypothetical protein